MKYGVVDVGGGYRGVFAAGVMDYCIEKDIHFDLAIGISAGSANLINYAARQHGRCLKFYTEYGMRKEYSSAQNFIKKHNYVDLDYIYGTLSNSDGECPLDYETFSKSDIEFYVVACNAVTGQSTTFTRADLSQDHYEVLKASSCLPGVCRPYPVGDQLYFDGALGDTIPIDQAFEKGCDRVVLLLTKPEGEIRKPGKDQLSARMIRRKYPKAYERLMGRAERYNKGVAHAQALAREGKVLIVAPDDTCGVDTLSKDVDSMMKLYQKGVRDGEKIKRFMEG